MADTSHSSQGIWFGCCHMEPMGATSARCAADTCPCKTCPSALKEEHAHPLYHPIFHFLTVAAYARKTMPEKTILQDWRLFPKPGSPAVGRSRDRETWLPGIQAAAGRRSHLPVLFPKEDYKLKSNLLNLWVSNCFCINTYWFVGCITWLATNLTDFKITVYTTKPESKQRHILKWHGFKQPDSWFF